MSDRCCREAVPSVPPRWQPLPLQLSMDHFPLGMAKQLVTKLLLSCFTCALFRMPSCTPFVRLAACLCILARFCLQSTWSFASHYTLAYKRCFVFMCENQIKRRLKIQTCPWPIALNRHTEVSEGAGPKDGVAQGSDKQVWECEIIPFDTSTSLCKCKLIVKLSHNLPSCIRSQWAPCLTPGLLFMA